MSPVEQDIETARRRFIAWLEWYRRRPPHSPADPMSKQELADNLGTGITRSAISQLIDPKNRRAPDFATLIAAAKMIGFGYEALLTKDPPHI